MSRTTTRPPPSRPRPSLPAGIYNVADDEPLRHRDFVDTLAHAVGAAPPRLFPDWLTQIGGSLARMYARSLRISNMKLRAQGWAPRYPSVRDGLPPAIAALRLTLRGRPDGRVAGSTGVRCAGNRGRGRVNSVIIVGVWGSPVVSAVVWAAALAGLVWMVVPAIAFALRIGSVRTVVLPDVGPPALRGGDGAFEPWSTQLAALGFRHAGRTRESARFMSPTQWSWQSVHPAPWLISPDGETYASMYRIVPNEPVRISAVTAFEGGGIVRTACPGPLPQDGLPPDHRYTSVRGVDANGLLARHGEQVAAFANERGAPSGGQRLRRSPRSTTPSWVRWRARTPRPVTFWCWPFWLPSRCS